jgi:hypothetical protein
MRQARERNLDLDFLAWVGGSAQYSRSPQGQQDEWLFLSFCCCCCCCCCCCKMSDHATSCGILQKETRLRSHINLARKTRAARTVFHSRSLTPKQSKCSFSIDDEKMKSSRYSTIFFCPSSLILHSNPLVVQSQSRHQSHDCTSDC